jgi:hypothetical protein
MHYPFQCRICLCGDHTVVTITRLCKSRTFEIKLGRCRPDRNLYELPRNRETKERKAKAKRQITEVVFLSFEFSPSALIEDGLSHHDQNVLVDLFFGENERLFPASMGFESRGVIKEDPTKNTWK